MGSTSIGSKLKASGSKSGSEIRYNPEQPSPKLLKACQTLKKFIFEIGVHLIHIHFKQLVYYTTHFYMIYTFYNKRHFKRDCAKTSLCWHKTFNHFLTPFGGALQIEKLGS